jgi:Tfp pilus assembly protein PilF
MLSAHKFQRGDYAGATENLSKAIEINPEDTRGYEKSHLVAQASQKL